MHTNINEIYDLLRDYNAYLHKGNWSNQLVSGVSVAFNAKQEFSHDMLYLCYDFQLLTSLMQTYSSLNIVYLNHFTEMQSPRYKKSDFNIIYIASPLSPEFFLDKIKDFFFEKKKLFDITNRLVRLLNLNSSLRPIMDEAAAILGNPVCLYDLGSRTIYEARGDILNPEKMKLVEAHYQITTDPYSYFEYYNAYRKERYIEGFKKLTRASFSSSLSFPRYIVSSVFIDHTAVATFDIYEVNQKLTDFDLKIADTLSKVLSFELKRSNYFNKSGDIPCESTLRAILNSGGDNMSVPSKTVAAQLNQAYPQHKVLIAITPIDSEKQNNNLLYLNYLLKQDLKNCGIFLCEDDYICAICAVEDDWNTIESKTERQLCHFAASNNCYCGISQRFLDMQNIYEFWIQAKDTIKLASMMSWETSIYYYNDLLPLELLYKCSYLDLKSFCHPALIKILEYDKNNGTNYERVLKLYLESGQNKSQVAKALHLNRGTVIEQIHKLTMKFDIDFQNRDALFHLTFSFQILDFVKAHKKKQTA